MAEPEAMRSEEMSVAARVSNEVVRTMKELYGKGPTQAKTYLCDEYVFCVMRGGLTRNEETLMRGEEHEVVRDFRMHFQRLISPEISRRVESVLGRKVLSYHSQVLFNPDRIVEIFIVEPQPGEE